LDLLIDGVSPVPFWGNYYECLEQQHEINNASYLWKLHGYFNIQRGVM